MRVVTGSRPVIGWYAHHHGAGHVARARTVAARMDARVVVLSSARRPFDWPSDDWVQLPSDADPVGQDATAGGSLHWAPLHHPGYEDRMTAIATWVAATGPAAVVVDVSVEVTMLVRLLGVPVVTFLKPGDRSDAPHQLAYDASTELFATWPRRAQVIGGWQQRWDAKTTWLGAFSRFDGRPVSATPGGRSVTLVWGRGGTDVSEAQIDAARRATPDWDWTVCTDLAGDELWGRLQSARVVVGHAGQNVLSEIAAARRPAVIIAQERPHDEQRHTVRALTATGLGHGLEHWPEADAWPELLAGAAPATGADWARWSDRTGADRCAARLDEIAGLFPGRPAFPGWSAKDGESA
ncbi:MAG: hypothetical protein ABIS35_09370 [Terracoccus sp.]